MWDTPPGAVRRASRTQSPGARQSPGRGVRSLGLVPIQRSRRAPRDGNGSKVTAGARRRPRRGNASPARTVSGAWRRRPEPRRLRAPGGLRPAEGRGLRGPRWPEATPKIATLPSSSVRSHLLQEAFPDSWSPWYLLFQGVYNLGLCCLIMGLSPQWVVSFPEGRVSAILTSLF